MSKLAGLGQQFYAGGRDVSGDIGALGTARTSRAVQDVTGIDKFAIERLALLADGQIDFTAFMNPSADQSHDAFKGLPTADVLVMWFFSQTLGDVCAMLAAKQVGWDSSRGADGSLSMAASALSANDAIEWGRMLTAGIRTDSGAVAAPDSVDLVTASTAFGAVAQLQVFAFTGTSITVDLEDSADDISFATIASMSFSAVSSAPATERVESPLTGTIRRYVRAPSAGTFSNAEFAVGFMRREVAGY